MEASRKMIDDIHNAVVAEFLRLRPFGENTDSRLRGAAISDDTCMQAAARIVCTALFEERRALGPNGIDADREDGEERQA
jgi:hypothetical protein